MKYIALNLTALSPLAIRADHAPGGAATAPYITGATLAGSLAAVYRQAYPAQTAEFERLFLSGQVQYPNLYPASFKHPAARDEIALPVYPIPKTAQSCKRFPGFAGDVEDDDPKHGVRDSLFDWAVFELGGRTHTALMPLLKHKTCVHESCDKAIHHFEGFYRRVKSGRAGQLLAQAKATTRLQTHTGIDRATGTVQEGILYSREVFVEQERFAGVVKLPDELAKPFEHFIAQMGNVGLIRVGNGRSRGMGKVQLTAQIPQEQIDFKTFKQRLEDFNYALKQQVKKMLPEQKLAPFHFALTLHSPAILLDPLLRYRGSIDEQTLHELTGLPVEHFERICQIAGVRQVTGWSELWGTPRTNEYAIESGSVFLFEFSGNVNEDFYKKLFDLEENSIGQRRGEGFGRVCISDPFHLEGRSSDES